MEQNKKYRRINLTVEEREKWIKLLYDYFFALPNEPASLKEFKESDSGKLSNNSLLSFCEKIVLDCESGWKRCPKDFQQRIRLKSGWDSPNRARKSASIQDKSKDNSKDVRNNTSLQILEFLTEDEQKFFDGRIKEYIRDFDFNSSSDMPLVERLVVEEIMHKRLTILQLDIISGKRLKNNINADAVTSSLNDVHKRMIDLQKQLGISRQQRADELNKGAHSIAEMSYALDEKLKKFPELRRQLFDEEQKFYAEKMLEEPINPVPERSQLESMMKSSNSNEIFDNVVDRVIQQQFNKKEEEKNLLDLPGGLNL